MKKILVGMVLLIVAIPAVGFLLPSAAAEEPTATAAAAEGQRKATVCISCHGDVGNTSNGQHPKLAGQHLPYLITAMRAYRDGRRDSDIMRSFTANLSDKDIDDIAAFYARQPAK